MAVSNVDPDAKKPETKTVKYGSDQVNANPAQPADVNDVKGANNVQPNSTSYVGQDESVDSVAERAVVERHGPQARNLPNFKDLVKEESRQIKENIEHTKGM